MRKIWVVLLAALLVVGLTGGPSRGADKTRKRKEMGAYMAPVIGYYTPTTLRAGGVCDGASNVGCVMFDTQADEDLISVRVKDETGGAVAGVVWQAGASGYEIIGEFCSATDVPISNRYPGEPISVNVYNGMCLDGSLSVVTRGTIKVAFLARR